MVLFIQTDCCIAMCVYGCRCCKDECVVNVGIVRGWVYVMVLFVDGGWCFFYWCWLCIVGYIYDGVCMMWLYL